MCTVCQLWMHKKCSKLTDNMFNFLNDMDEQGIPSVWACDSCGNATRSLNNKLALLEKRLNDQEKRMDAQDEIIQTNTRDIVKVKEDMVNLRQQPSGDCDSIFKELKEREAKKVT